MILPLLSNSALTKLSKIISSSEVLKSLLASRTVRVNLSHAYSKPFFSSLFIIGGGRDVFLKELIRVVGN